jgi:hypothetical protein
MAGGDYDPDRIGGAFVLVIFREALAQPVDFDPYASVLYIFKICRLAEDVYGDGVFGDGGSVVGEAAATNVTQELGESARLLESA